jgi:hypothetical protein
VFVLLLIGQAAIELLLEIFRRLQPNPAQCETLWLAALMLELLKA